MKLFRALLWHIAQLPRDMLHNGHRTDMSVLMQVPRVDIAANGALLGEC